MDAERAAQGELASGVPAFDRMADGSFRGVWLMSLLRREWLAAHGVEIAPLAS